MAWLRLVRAEVRKLTTTKLPWGFAAVLAVVAAINAVAILFGTDMDGSKDFIATAADQQSLLAFGGNALLLTGLFGAIAVAREYGHGTVVPMFLAAPRRAMAMSAQLAAILIGGALLGLLGGVLVLAAGVASLPFVDQAFLLTGGVMTRLVATAAFAGAVGAVLGAGLGAVVRNPGGAVTAAVVLLFIAPPLLVQMASATASWVPDTLTAVLSGVGEGPTVLAAAAALAAWALVPAAVGMGVIQRRDVV